MKNTSSRLYKFISLLTALMIVCSCFPVFISEAGRVKAVDPVEIKTFKTGFLEGAELQDDGKYVWTPLTFESGHKFIYYVTFSLTGKDYFDAGEIRLTLPLRLLKDRENNYADELELSVPSKEEVDNYEGELSETDNQFQYVVDGDNIVITNFRIFSAASTGYIEVAFVTSKTTYEYKDMSCSDDFYADIELLSTDQQVITSDHSEAVPVYIDTSAKINYTSKRCLNLIEPYSSWNSGWGRTPDNADDYYYLMWELVSGTSLPTQPYDIEIADDITEGFGEPIAYKFAGESVFTSRNYRKAQQYATENCLRYDYVITRHLKTDCDSVLQYYIKNRETITVTPIDEIDEPTTVSAEASFSYYRRPFSAPGQYIWSEKRGNSNWWTYWPIADYALQDLKDGPERGGADEIGGNIKFAVNTSAYVFPLTRETGEGVDIEDINSYGKRKVKFTVTDDSFFLNHSFEFNHDKAIILPEHRRLTAEDFRIEHIDYSYRLEDGKKDNASNSFVGVTAIPDENDILTFFFKFDDGDWIETARYNIKTKQAEILHDEYISKFTGSRIEFSEGVSCVGYRIEAENAHYATNISATPYCMIKRSPYVLEQSEGVNRITLTNISNFTVTDDNSTTVYDRDSLAEDYIIGVEKEGTIQKQVAFTNNNTLKRYVTIGWQVKISEHYMTNNGLVYVPQETGVFYDLLPIGTALDESSIRVGIDYGDFMTDVHWLKANEFEVSRKNNYKNSGRTLLIVKIKSDFKRAVVCYNTVYSWDSAMDYGTELMNTVAYETGNDRIGGGYPDDGGEIEDKEIMRDLDKSSDGWKFIYEQKQHRIRILVSTRTGLTKTVSTNKTTNEMLDLSVRQGSDYTYKLRYSTTIFTRAADMVIYDSLENFTDGTVHSDWHGILDSVNLQQPRLIGIEPVLYLSAVEGLDINVYHDVDSDMKNGERVWLREEEFAARYGDPEAAPEGGYDLSKAHAVAIDLRYDANGERFILPFNSSVVTELYMKAPDKDDSGSPDPVTYNNVYIHDTIIDMFGVEEPDNFIHQDYTGVHFKIYGDLRIRKHEADNEDVLIKDIGFTLTGTSDYGTVYDASNLLYTDSDGRLVFTDIEKGKYTLAEADGSDDYLPIEGTISVTIDEYGRTTVGGRLLEDDEYYHISNEPRVHADIEFTKKDILHKYNPVKGAKFKLEGRSVYSPEENYLTYAVSDSDGKVSFKNIEWGTYTITEVQAPENYVRLKGVEFSAYVDGDGNFHIRADDDLAAGFIEGQAPYYTIYNEPYHQFTIVKMGLTGGSNVVGAKFRLSGTSDFDNYYSRTETTNDRGILTFTGLEQGSYTLKEIEAPTGFVLDDRDRLVTVKADGEITIEGLTQDGQGRFVLTNKEDGTITVIKKWVDNETTESRLEKGIVPTITISSEHDPSEATFASNMRTLMLNLTKASSSDSQHADRILAFKQYTKINGKVIVLHGLEDGTVVRADDNTTENRIYMWLIKDETAADYGTVYWWSDARDVYFPTNSSSLFSGFNKMTVFDAFGLNFSKVQNMYRMFYNSGISEMDLSGKDMGEVTTISQMFCNCPNLETVDFSGADLSKMTNASGFCNLKDISGDRLRIVDLHGADLSSLTNLKNAFCSKNLETINFSGCTFGENSINMERAFCDWGSSAYGNNVCGCPNLTSINFDNINGTIYVNNMKETFGYSYYGTNACTSLRTINLSSFDTSRCSSMQGTFSYCSSLEILDLSSFNTSSVTNMSSMFCNCTNLEEIKVNNEIFDTSHVTTMSYMFYNCVKLTDDDIEDMQIDTSGCTNMSNMFYACKITTSDVIDLDTSKVTDMSSMFMYCKQLITANIKNKDLSKVQNMYRMFYNSGISEMDLSGKDLGEVTTISEMFYNCPNLEKVDFSGADLSKMTNASGFCNLKDVSGDRLRIVDLHGADLSSLTNLKNAFCSINLKTIDFSECTFGENSINMERAFCDWGSSSNGNGGSGCHNLTNINFDNINGTIYVNNLKETFGYYYNGTNACTSLRTINLSGFDTSRCNSMQGTFSYCSSLETLDLSCFNTSSVTNTSSMFYNCSLLETVVVSEKWNTENVTSSSNMFYGCSSIIGKNGTTYNSAKTDKTYARVDDPANGKPGYFTDVPTTGSGKRTITVFSTSSSADSVTFTSDDNEHCILTYIDDRTWEYTFTGIDASLDYFAWENEIENYTHDYKGYVEVVSGKAVITNYTDVDTPAFGSLNIKKVLDAQEGAVLTQDELENKTYTFTVILTNENEQPLSGSQILAGTVFVNGTARVSLKGGEDITITDIPAGYHYSVAELAAEGYETTVEGEAEGVIIEDQTISVVFTNTKIFVEEYQAAFTLEKIVNGNGNADKDEYTFTVDLDRLRRNTLYTLSNGESFRSTEEGKANVPVTLKNGESVVFTVPDGTTAQITENGGENYASEYQLTVNGAQKKHGTARQGKELTTARFTADKDSETVVTFTNTKNVRQNLTILKTVDGGSPDNDDEFEFDVELSGLAAGERVTFNMGTQNADIDGKCVLSGIRLKAGHSLIFYSLPAGVKYRVTEKESDYIASYRLTDANGGDSINNRSAENEEIQRELATDLETIDEGEEMTVEFINRKVTRDVTVTKTVDGTDGALTPSEFRSRQFRFVTELSGLTANKQYTVRCISSVNNVTVEHEESFTASPEGAAVYEILLRDGEQFTITDLPENAVYTVTEKGEKFYIASFDTNCNDGAIIALPSAENTFTNRDLSTASEIVDTYDKDVVFNFTNTYAASDYALPAAGLPDRRPLTIIFLAGLIASASAYLYVKRKLRSQE